MNILEQLKSGKCLCTVCKRVQEPGWFQNGEYVCADNCAPGSGWRAKPVITWDLVQSGEILPDGLSVEDYKFIADTYPEIIAEADRVNEIHIQHVWEPDLMAAE